jgi:hypothetical protein
MSRLIDADKGIEEYKEIRRKLIEKGADLFGDEIDGLDYIIRQLELQPTAYSVEAVIRELGKQCDANAGGLYKEQIIEIVRGGWNDCV